MQCSSLKRSHWSQSLILRRWADIWTCALTHTTSTFFSPHTICLARSTSNHLILTKWHRCKLDNKHFSSSSSRIRSRCNSSRWCSSNRYSSNRWCSRTHRWLNSSRWCSNNRCSNKEWCNNSRWCNSNSSRKMLSLMRKSEICFVNNVFV